MDMLKRFRKRLIIIVAICLVAGFGYVRKAVSPVSAPIVPEKTIIIDAGHGGFDGGAGADDGTLEKDINLEIAKKAKDYLAFYGYDVIMTREDDTGTEDNPDLSISARKKSDLRNRLEMMQTDSATIYVSIHLNKFTTSAASGTQVFYTPNFDEARVLGECIQSTVISLLQPENHRVIKKGTDSTFLLKNAKIPAVIVECGFLSNAGDLKNLKEETYQRKLAFCICYGIMKYYKEI